MGKSDYNEFFQGKRTLILDASSATREMIRQLVLGSGANTEDVFSTGKYDQAVLYIKDKQPQIVMTDIKVENQSGLALVQKVKEYARVASQRLLIVISSNADETAIAEAAEEDVDSYLIRPFSADTLEKFYIEALETKVRPSPFLVSIEEGKRLLADRGYDEALKHFEAAKTQSKKPSLAFYYIGEVYRQKEQFDQALASYDEGLSHNSIHYRCLLGKFETLYSQKKLKPAYEVVQLITEHFPVSPQKLGKVFELAVHTHSFADSKRYFELFKQLDHRTEELKVIVIAALVVSGKYLTKVGMFEDALQNFRDAISTSQMSLVTIENCCNYLIRHKRFEDAEKLMGMVSPDAKTTNDYKELEFQFYYQQAEARVALKIGQELIAEKEASADVYAGVIEMLIQGESYRRAENTIFDAMSVHKDQRERFAVYADQLEKFNSK